jgi:phosphoribosylformimino-5-aminoimidazole carboxamide ribotide isomerase
VFRPCIDLRNGRVVQIVGGTLADDPAAAAGERVNFVSDRYSSWYAALYRGDDLRGGHVIKLGPGNDDAARAALAAWPGGMQIGGGIDDTNAAGWLDAGASHVIVTSWLFDGPAFVPDRLARMLELVGRERLVLDLSCRWRDGAYWVVTDRWQTFTSMRVDAATLAELAGSCAEFLVHGVDVEGLAQGIDLDLVGLLAGSCPIPCTYAGGARSLDDLRTVHAISDGRVDLTIGSALDIFGGTGVAYADCVEFNHNPRSGRLSPSG